MLKLYYDSQLIEAGCDEAGRGCIAGPVVAAAVILPKDVVIEGLNDSKKLTDKQRKKLREEIQEVAIAYAVAEVSHTVVDEINVLNASILAMHHALDKLEVTPEFILVDGNRFKPYKEIAHKTVIGGDGLYMSIAAASILAKTYRDDLMERLDLEYPYYNWKKNKGYPTKEHRAGVVANGISPYHRTSFRILDEQYSLDLEF